MMSNHTPANGRMSEYETPRFSAQRQPVPVEASEDRQIDGLFLDVASARMKLSELASDTPVLLVTSEALGQMRAGAGPGWQRALAQTLLEQVDPEATARVLYGPADVELHPAARLAFCGGHELQLTSTEFALLQELLTQGGSVVSVDELSEAVWGHETLGAPNYVEAHVSRLRRKLREVGAGRVVETVRGAGYRVRRPRSGRDLHEQVGPPPMPQFLHASRPGAAA